MQIPASLLFADTTVDDLYEVINENPSLRGYLQGYLAELYLKRQLLTLPGIQEVVKIPDRDPRKGDLLVAGKRGGVSFSLTVEVKSLSSLGIKEDLLEGGVTGQVVVKGTDRKEIKGQPATCCLPPGEFDVLAICTLPLTKQWTYLFIESRHLPLSGKFPGRLLSQVQVNPQTTPGLYQSFERILQAKLAPLG